MESFNRLSTLSFPPYTSAESTLSLEPHPPTSGIALIALTHIPQGSEIFRESPLSGITLFTPPSSSSSSSSSPPRSSMCACCLSSSSSSTLSACAGCAKTTFYCSKSCQKRDWKSGGHKKECPILPPLQSLLQLGSLSPQDAQLLRMAARAAGVCSKSPPSRSAFLSQISHPPTSSHTSLAQHAISLSLNLDSLLPPSDVPDADQDGDTKIAAYASVFSRFDANNFGVMQDAPPKAVGFGIYPGSATMNHSCTPSTVLHMWGSEGGPDDPLSEAPRGTLICVAARDIAPGEELTHAYTDVGEHTYVQALAASGIDPCVCGSCPDPASLAPPSPGSDTQAAWDSIRAAFLSSKTESLDLQAAIETVTRDTSPTHPLVRSALEMGVTLAASSANLSLAASLAQQWASAAHAVYGPLHPKTIWASSVAQSLLQ